MTLTVDSSLDDICGSEDLIGKRVQIRATKELGSAGKLNNLTATVTAAHPIAPNWLKIVLDPNDITGNHEWSIPADRLIVYRT
ncbi:MAG: hypothetical protein M3Y72_02955 [Acidobacteriota bacterium]|nr:hypothetical protein [Acidobacteriota bacterium]